LDREVQRTLEPVSLFAGESKARPIHEYSDEVYRNLAKVRDYKLNNISKRRGLDVAQITKAALPDSRPATGSPTIPVRNQSALVARTTHTDIIVKRAAKKSKDPKTKLSKFGKYKEGDTESEEEDGIEYFSFSNE